MTVLCPSPQSQLHPATPAQASQITTAKWTLPPPVSEFSALRFPEAPNRSSPLRTVDPLEGSSGRVLGPYPVSREICWTVERARASVRPKALMGTLIFVSCNGTQKSYCVLQIVKNTFGHWFSPLDDSANDMFSQQILNCQQGGGVAAIIFNNEEGPLDVNINGQSDITIPAVGITMEDGSLLRSSYVGQLVALTSDERYSFADGTSFASPHVAGAAAAIWQLCPACSNSQVRSCLQSTAQDLGDQGRDDFFGYGLVQVESAYLCLKNTEQCCQEVEATPSPQPITTTAPAQPSDECRTAETSYQSCLSTTMPDLAQSCVDCINTIPTALATADCTAINADYCPGLTQCGCDPCQNAIELYLTCFIQSQNPDASCALSCPNAGSPTPAPEPLTRYPTLAPVTIPVTSSPTMRSSTSATSSPVTGDCESKLSSARACLVSEMDSSGALACTQCVNSAIPSTTKTCDEIESQMCSAFDTCSCGTCQVLIEDYFTCSYGFLSCDLQCSTSAIPVSSAPAAALSSPPTSRPPTTLPITTLAPSLRTTALPSAPSTVKASSAAPSAGCSAESEGYQMCFNATLDDSTQEACKSCVSATIQASYQSSCDVLQTAVCDSVQFCPCGECGSPLQDYLSCFYGTDSCPISCDANPTSCGTEQDAYSSCLYSSLSAQESSMCQGCVMQAGDNFSVQSLAASDCDDVQTQACNSVDSCSDCGACSAAARQLMACHISDRSQGACTIDCSSTSAPAPPSEANPLPATAPSVGGAESTRNRTQDGSGSNLSSAASPPDRAIFVWLTSSLLIGTWLLSNQ